MVVVVSVWWLAAAFWVQCAIGAAVIAKLNGRALGTWFAIGLVLGVVGVVAAVVAGPPVERAGEVMARFDPFPLVAIGALLVLALLSWWSFR